MTIANPFNMIISGLGGQGTFSLTKIIWQTAKEKGFNCQGSTFKGGAQKHGSIHSVLRIFTGYDPDYSNFSTQIPVGELDLIIGMEPWETLRYNKYFGSQTNIVMNSQITPFFMERESSFHSQNNTADPVKAVESLQLPSIIRNYTEKSIKEFGSSKMANYLIAFDAAAPGILPFTTKEFTQVFINQFNLQPDIEAKLHEKIS